MRSVIIDIERVTISLRGLSSPVAEAATHGLEMELSRRLSRLTTSEVRSLCLGALALAPVQADSVLDASALRGIIADRLAGALLQSVPPGDTGESEGQ